MDDAFGYGRLLADLEAIRTMLASAGLARASEEVSRAIAFSGGGSPTEFMGESRIALLRVLDESNLPRAAREETERVVKQIDLGFENR